MSDELALFLVFGLLPMTLVLYAVVGVLPPWWVATRARLPLSLITVISLRIRGVNALQVVQLLIAARESGVQGLTAEDAAEAYLYRADLPTIQRSITQAAEQGRPIDFWDLVDQTLQAQGIRPITSGKTSEEASQAERSPNQAEDKTQTQRPGQESPQDP